MKSDFSEVDSSDFFRCLICRERVHVYSEGGHFRLDCSCGLSFAPGVAFKHKLLALWNSGLIRNIEYIEKPFSFPSLLRSSHFYYWLGSIVVSIGFYFSSIGFSGSSIIFGLLCLFYAFGLRVTARETLESGVEILAREEFRRLASRLDSEIKELVLEEFNKISSIDSDSDK